MAILISLFYVLAAISIILGLYLIKNLGLGAETKKRIMLRHVGLVLAYTVCNIYVLYCVGKREELGDESDAHIITAWYVKLMQGLFFSQGLILSLVRMLEPGSFQLHYKLLRNAIQCKKDQEADDLDQM